MNGERKHPCHVWGEETSCHEWGEKTAVRSLRREDSGSVVRACVDWMLIDPPAAILLPAFGQKGTLAFWAFVVAVQYMMGSSMVSAHLLAVSFRPAEATGDYADAGINSFSPQAGKLSRSAAMEVSPSGNVLRPLLMRST